MGNSEYKEDPKILISELWQQFHEIGWITNTGGGISIINENTIYSSPVSGEVNLKPEDVEVSIDNVGRSICVNFVDPFKVREATALIHSHSEIAVLASLIFPGDEFTITHQEMIKGIYNWEKGRHYYYDEKLVLPIVDHSDELRHSLEYILCKNPETSAILVRKHGLYVWGKTWKDAKTMCECYEYLLDLAVRMSNLKLDPNATPEEHELKFLRDNYKKG